MGTRVLQATGSSTPAKGLKTTGLQTEKCILHINLQIYKSSFQSTELHLIACEGFPKQICSNLLNASYFFKCKYLHMFDNKVVSALVLKLS